MIGFKHVFGVVVILGEEMCPISGVFEHNDPFFINKTDLAKDFGIGKVL
jgi:hypothetical protein